MNVGHFRHTNDDLRIDKIPRHSHKLLLNHEDV